MAENQIDRWINKKLELYSAAVTLSSTILSHGRFLKKIEYGNHLVEVTVDQRHHDLAQLFDDNEFSEWWSVHWCPSNQKNSFSLEKTQFYLFNTMQEPN